MALPGSLAGGLKLKYLATKIVILLRVQFSALVLLRRVLIRPGVTPTDGLRNHSGSDAAQVHHTWARSAALVKVCNVNKVRI